MAFQTGPLGRGAVTPFGFGTREVLTANRTYYVNTSTGNNGNNGLTSGAPFLTLAYALGIVGVIDFNGYNVTVQLADGTYTEAVSIPLTVGQFSAASLAINGNGSTPTNVIITTSSNNNTITVPKNAQITLQNLTVSNSTASLGRAIGVGGGHCILGSGLTLGACTSEQVFCSGGGLAEGYSALTVTGNAVSLFNAGLTGYISFFGTVAFGTVTYSTTIQAYG